MADLPEQARTRVSSMELFAAVALIALGAAVVYAAAKPRLITARAATCQGNLKWMGQAYRVYAKENRGYLPSVQRHLGRECKSKNTHTFAPDGPALYPEYLDDPSVLLCPFNPHVAEADTSRIWQEDGQVQPCLFDDRSYTYTGWLITPTAESLDTGELASPNWAAYGEGLYQHMNRMDAASLDDAWSYPDGSGNVRQVPRLSLQLGRATNPASVLPSHQAYIPIMFDLLLPMGERVQLNHLMPPINVLYLDGHVEPLRETNAFPMTPGWFESYRRIKDSAVRLR